jgi:hypothetical protein
MIDPDSDLIWCPACGSDAVIADTIGDRLLMVRCSDENCGWATFEELEPDREAVGWPRG